MALLQSQTQRHYDKAVHIKLYLGCTYVRLTTGPVSTNKPIPTTGPIPTTRPKVIHHSHIWTVFPTAGLKIICHSHNWTDAETYTSFPQMGRFYIDNRNDVTLLFPNDTNPNRKITFQRRTTILHTTAPGIDSGRSSCKRGPYRCLCPKRRPLLWTVWHGSDCFSWKYYK